MQKTIQLCVQALYFLKSCEAAASVSLFFTQKLKKIALSCKSLKKQLHTNFFQTTTRITKSESHNLYTNIHWIVRQLKTDTWWLTLTDSLQLITDRWKTEIWSETKQNVIHASVHPCIHQSLHPVIHSSIQQSDTIFPFIRASIHPSIHPTLPDNSTQGWAPQKKQPHPWMPHFRQKKIASGNGWQQK